MAYINVSIICRHCGHLLRTPRLPEGSRSTTNGECVCPRCKKRVQFSYNGCRDTFYAS